MDATSSMDAKSPGTERLINETFHDGVFHIELNRPDAGNTANKMFADQLLAAVLNAKSTTCVRVLLLSAAGRNFMAGGDLAALGGDGVHPDPAAEADLLSGPLADVISVAFAMGCD